MTAIELTSKRKIDLLLNKMQFLTPEKYDFLVDELLALITTPMSLLTLVDQVAILHLIQTYWTREQGCLSDTIRFPTEDLMTYIEWTGKYLMNRWWSRLTTVVSPQIGHP
jgi:hypothetical protein